MAYSKRTRGNDFKLKERRFRLEIRENYFTMRVGQLWHRLFRKVVEASSLKTFLIRLDWTLSNLS